MTKRRSFSDKFKAMVALEALRGDRTAREIAATSQMALQTVLGGPFTRLTLVRFQRAYRLTPDGIYGPATGRALESSPNGRC